MLIGLLFFHFGKSQDLFSYDNSVKYANFLMKTRQYNFAIFELHRLDFFKPGNDTIAYNLLKSYRLANQQEKGIKWLENKYQQVQYIPELCVTEYFRLLNANKDFNKIDRLITKGLLSQEQTVFYSVSNSIHRRNYKKAKNLYNDNAIDYRHPVLDNVFFTIENTKFKQPALAGIMSTIVPGTGKIYTGFWKDGLFALTSVGLSAYQSYSGFKKKGAESFYGWFFLSTGFILYLANIYGSIKSAKFINTKHAKEINFKLDAFINADDDFIPVR